MDVLLSLGLGAAALSLALVGYASVGGTYADAVRAAAKVVGRVSTSARRISPAKGTVTLELSAPALSTYKDARLRIVASGRDADVRPPSQLVTSPTEKRSAEFTIDVVDTGRARRTVDFTIYDADSMRPVARLAAVVPRARREPVMVRLVRRVQHAIWGGGSP